MDAKWLKRLSALLAASSAAFAGTNTPAMAQPCTPTQTVAVLDQYCDILPTAGGAVPPTGSHAPRGPSLGAMLPQQTVTRLRHSGPEARALLQLTMPMPVAQTPGATARELQTSRAARDRVASGKLDAPKRIVESVAGGLTAAGSNVVGGTFRWGLVICTLGLAGMTWFRFRARLRI